MANALTLKTRQTRKNKLKLDRAFSNPKRIVKCHWCHRKIYRWKLVPKMIVPDDHATVDHIYSKDDIRRNLISENRNTVISCHECNCRRNEEFLIREEKWEPYIIGIVRTGITD